MERDENFIKGFIAFIIVVCFSTLLGVSSGVAIGLIFGYFLGYSLNTD